MFDIQSMKVTPSPKAMSTNEIICFLNTCGFLFVANIIIDIIIACLTLCNPPTPVVPNIDLPTC